MYTVFTRHPLPWKYVENAAVCGNGGRIDVIEDAAGEHVASSYNSGFRELWALYNVLTLDQAHALGAFTEPPETAPPEEDE